MERNSPKISKYCTHNVRCSQSKMDATSAVMTHRESPMLLEKPVLRYDIKVLTDNISKLPDGDQEVINYYYYERLTQKQIAHRVNMSQGGISYKLNRASKRLRYLYESEITDKEISSIECLTPLQKQIMRFMIDTSSYAETARRLDTSFSKIRYRFRLSLSYLKSDTNKIAQKLYNVGRVIIDNFTIMAPFNYRSYKNIS